LKSTIFVVLISLFFGCAGSSDIERSSELTIKYSLLNENSSDQYLSTNNLDTTKIIMPRLIQPISPEYPQLAAQHKIIGSILVKVWIDTAGNVLKTNIIKTDNEIFNASAVIAVMCWKFSPLIKDGMTTPCSAEIPISFQYFRRVVIPN